MADEHDHHELPADAWAEVERQAAEWQTREDRGATEDGK